MSDKPNPPPTRRSMYMAAFNSTPKELGESAVSYFSSLREERHQEWMSHISPEIDDLSRRANPITLAEYQALWMNSWEREHVFPNLSDEALLWEAETVLKNCSRPKSRPYAVYDDVLQHMLVPELLKRWKATWERE